MRQHHAVDRAVVVQVERDLDHLRRRRRGHLVRRFSTAAPALGGWRSLLGLDHHARRDAPVHQHQRAMALLIEEDLRGEIPGAFDVDDVGFAVVGLGFTGGAVLERQRRRRSQQERQRGAGELGVGVADGLYLGVAGRRRTHADHHAGGAVQRLLVAQQLVAVHPLFGDDRRVAHRAHRLGAQQLVGQLQVDRHFAGQLAILHRALVGAGGGQPPHLVEILRAAERRARLRDQLFGPGVAGRARDVAADGQQQREQIHNQSLHVITSLSSMTSGPRRSCYLYAIVL